MTRVGHSLILGLFPLRIGHADLSFELWADLPSQVYASQHDVLGVVVKDAEAEVCSLQEHECCSLDFVWELQGPANSLELLSIVLQELLLLLKSNCFDFACKYVLAYTTGYLLEILKAIVSCKHSDGWGLYSFLGAFVLPFKLVRHCSINAKIISLA